MHGDVVIRCSAYSKQSIFEGEGATNEGKIPVRSKKKIKRPSTIAECLWECRLQAAPLVYVGLYGIFGV